MPTVKYSNNPNEDTAFVTMEDDTRTRAVLTVPVDGTVKFSDNPNSTKVKVTVDGEDHMAVAVYNLNGGDGHNKGYYADQEALEEAYPTGEAGDYAVVGDTDTIWIWDEDTSAWVDSDQKGQVTSVNGQTGDVTLTANSVGALPSSGGTVTGEVDIIRENPNNNAQTVLILGAKNTSTDVTKTVKFTMAAGGTASQLQTDANIVPIKHTQSLGSGSIPWRDVYVERLHKDSASMFYLPDGIGFGVASVFSMPTPNAAVEGSMLLYVGQTGSTYTHGYIYECKAQGTDPETYAWEAVEVQASSGGLPTQTGNAGKFLTTDGTNASWSDKAVVNNATGSDSLSVLGGATTATRAIAIGTDATVTVNYGIAIGSYLTQSAGGIALGQAAQTNGSGIAIGHNNPEAKAGTGHCSIAIGLSQKANVAGATQIGTNPNIGINSDANTFKVSNENGNYEIMSADGTIPEARLADTTTAQQGDVLTLDGNGNAVWAAGASGTSSISITLPAASWVNDEQTVTATGVTASNTVIVGATPSSASEYNTSGVICTAQGADSLTFSCSTTPSNDLTVTVLIF